MKIFYKPARIFLIVDILILLLSFYIVLNWFPLTTNSPFYKYSWPSIFYIITWLVFSYFFKRYIPLRKQPFFSSAVKLFSITIIVTLFYWVLIQLYFDNKFSEAVLISISVVALTLNYVALNIYFAYRYAVEYNDFIVEPDVNRINAKVKPAIPLDEETLNELRSTIIEHSGTRVLKYLEDNISLGCGNTLVFATNDAMIMKYQPQFQYSTVVQLEKLNNIKGINKMLALTNEKLPDDGIFVCCFETKSTHKKRILIRYKKGLNYIIYGLDFIIKRILPKIFLSNILYYSFVSGKNRILSKAEVLGRFYCCGYRVIKDRKIGQLTYVVAQRVQEPEALLNKTYGTLIRLHRYGKNGEPFEVYKMRTMHPYSEYLQSFIYERNSLNAGGKFYKDFRVTTFGRTMRKYWIDELPMLFNFLNGDMKLVGVRPLSPQYFSLYSAELQEKRNRYKPGLLPPFYADMPRSLEEIEASELAYLNSCQTKGVFITDIRYFFRILNNILFKRARSA
jgi:lipopolysaccharide/colanic/teichoic acid biosynthesis glycosyltransferase